MIGSQVSPWAASEPATWSSKDQSYWWRPCTGACGSAASQKASLRATVAPVAFTAASWASICAWL